MVEPSNPDDLVAWRMKTMERQSATLNNKVDNVQKEVNELKGSMQEEFAALRKTLFERPVFVTFELLKVELESRDRAIKDIEEDKNKDITDLKKALQTMSENTVSTTRHYATLIVTVLCVFIAPFISDYLGRIS